MKSVKKQFLVNDGTGFQMNYEIFEATLPVTTLFIHGNLASNRWWYPAQELWQKAPGTHQGQMILAEFRGCGLSSAPQSPSEVTMERLADDFIALVNNLSVGKINLVGHSTGGLIAALMLSKAPELFAKAVFLDPVGALGVKFEESMTAAFEQMKVDKNLTGLVIGSTIYQNNPEADFFRQVLVEDAFRAVNNVGALILRALDGLDSRSRIQKIEHPVLVLHGEYDQLLPMQDSQQLAAMMKNGQFQVVPGQGHCTNVENPEKFVQIVSQFLFQ